MPAKRRRAFSWSAGAAAQEVLQNGDLAVQKAAVQQDGVGDNADVCDHAAQLNAPGSPPHRASAAPASLALPKVGLSTKATRGSDEVS